MSYIDKIFRSANLYNIEIERWEKNLSVLSLILIDRLSSKKYSLNSFYLYFFKYNSGKFAGNKANWRYIFNNKFLFYFDNLHITRGLYSSIASKSFQLISNGRFFPIKSYKYNIYL